MTRLLLFLAAMVVTLTSVPHPIEAQYFGRNKVQYDQFDFRVLSTEHYDVHFYPEAAGVVEDAARMAERWYERIARVLEHDIRERRPLVFYADHPDFQQTNILRGAIGEGTGGVTEGLRDRIIMPLGDTYASTDHVLGHEIVHSFQFDIAQGRQSAGLQGLMRLPLWFVEGQAEYLSIGSESSLTGMWLRDAILHDTFPTLRQMSRDPRYFPYRFGHAFWAYAGGVYGDQAVPALLRASTRAGWETGVNRVLGISGDTLSVRWKEAATEHYLPLMEGRTPPGEAGTLLISPETGGGEMNLAPSLSPDGRYIAFLSERDLFTIELFLADAQTGEVIRSLTRSVRDTHFDALRFIDSAGGWSPTGDRIGISVFARGRNQIEIYATDGGARLQTVRVPERIGEIRNPAFSPDGESIVFSGQAGGMTNLFLVDLESGEVDQLTDDRHAALQPTFSSDGRTIAFVTDVGPGTDFVNLTFGSMSIGLFDLDTRQVEQLAPLGDADHWNPQFTPDGRELYFLADPDGFRDIYRVSLDDNSLVRVTRIVTAVSGITPATPAISVAQESGTVAFTVFDDAQYHVYSLDAVGAAGDPVQAGDVMAAEGRRLPGALPEGSDRVDRILADADVGLPPPDAFQMDEAPQVDRSLGLDWVGQPTIGAGTDQFGTFVAGSVAASFSDILGDRNLFAGVQAQGEIQDIGGQLFYQDVGRRWNWGVGASHIPLRFMRGFRVQDPDPNLIRFVQDTQRIFLTQALGQIQYPFSTTRRLEFGGGYSRYGFDVQRETFRFNQFGQLVDHRRESMDAADPLHLGEASVAFVGDNSFFGFTSPVRGWRYRFELSQTIGSVDFTQLTTDYRRYFAPFQELTLAMRGLHIGRYGSDIDSRVDVGTGIQTGSVIQPLFLGWENLLRGYSTQSFDATECTPTADGTCAEFERLLGQRIGVVNVEARIPLLGTDRYGIFATPLLPVELVAFADAGLAWSRGDEVDLSFERDTTARVPVFSTGLSARTNLFGAFILELYYAQPWQRPERGAHWGLHFSPGW